MKSLNPLNTKMKILSLLHMDPEDIEGQANIRYVLIAVVFCMDSHFLSYTNAVTKHFQKSYLVLLGLTSVYISQA